MIPDVTPNGVFYLPPTGWLTSFYNPPKKVFLEGFDDAKPFNIILDRLLSEDNVLPNN